VVFGHVPRFGGKEIARLPGIGDNGDQILRILISLGHGPINRVGSVDRDRTWVDATTLTGIQINDQEIGNFRNIRASVRMGNEAQAAIPGFSDIETVREVGAGGATLDNSSGFPVTGDEPRGEEQNFSTVSEVDSVVLRVAFPRGLYTVNDQGQFDAATATFRYRYRASSGPGAWSSWITWSVTQALQTDFVAARRIDGIDGQAVDIMVERASPTPQDASEVADALWVQVIEVTLSDERYPGQALLALEVTAGDQITGSPTFSVDIEGYADLSIWDGVDPLNPTFTRGYSANPAWIARELLTNTRWGAGASYGQNIAEAGPDLVKLAMRCDEQLERSDGSGTRPRHVFNYAMTSAADVVDQLGKVCRVARCVPVPVGQSWRFPFDGPKPIAVETITDATIATDGDGFAKCSITRRLTTGATDVPNRIVVQFLDEEGNAEPDTVGWPALGTSWLATEPLRERQVRLDGVTNRDEALAHARHIMKSERFRTQTITLEHTAEVLACTPGDRVDVSFSLPGYGTASGHIREGSTASRVLLDKDVTFADGESYTLRVVHLDNTVEIVDLGQPGSTTALMDDGLSLSTPLAQDPAEGAQYVVGRTGVESKPFTVQSISPVSSDELRWQIELVELPDGLFDDTVEDVERRDYSDLPDPRKAPGPVISLRCTEETTGVGRHFRLTWNQEARDREITAQFYVFRRRTGQTAWVRVSTSSIARHQAILGEIDDLDAGFQFRVVAVSPAGAFLSPFDSRHPTCDGVFGLGEQAPPPPDFVELVPAGDGTYTLRWNPVENAVAYQVIAGGDPNSTLPNTGAEDCFIVNDNVSGTELAGLRLTPGERADFWVRSKVTSGRLSVWTRGSHKAAAQAHVDSAATPVGESIRSTRSFDLATEGTITNGAFTDGVIRSDNPAADLVYESPEVDLGSAVESEITFKLDTVNDADDFRYRDSIFDVPSIPADQWGAIDADTVAMLTPPFPASAQSWVVEIRTNNGVSWSSWMAIEPFDQLEAIVQRYQIRVTMSRASFPYRPALRGLTAVVTS